MRYSQRTGAYNSPISQEFARVCNRGNLSPDAEGGVPGTSAKSVTVRGDAEAGDTVDVSSERLEALATESVPNVAVVVVVSGEEVAAREGEGNGGDTAEEVRGGVGHELSASAEVEEAASGVVRTSTESVARREELDGVDVGRVSREGLSADSRTDVPELSSVIASTRDEEVLVGGDGDAHNVGSVLGKFANLGSSLNIPLHAKHITRSRHNLLLRQESAARQISSVRIQLTAHADGRIATSQVVHGADVVQTSASNKTSTRAVRARHHPR